MRRFLTIAIFLGLIAVLSAWPSGADASLVTLTSTTPDRADPLDEVTLNLVITNTTSLMMWDPVIKLDLSGDEEGYFTPIDEQVAVDMGNQHFIPINGTVTTSYRIFVNSNCPAQKHVLPVIIMYRSGACENGCQNAEIVGQIAVPVYRQDPKVAMSIEGPEEVLPGDPLIISSTLKNFGTGSALNVQITAISDPVVQGLKTTVVNATEPLTLAVTGSIVTETSSDTMKMDPGFYTFYIYLQYEDKYGNMMSKEGQWEVKVIGTPSQEALFQADQLKELGINAYQIKGYTTAISYLERAIELYSRLDKQSDIDECQNYILLSTNYLQANNYFMKAEEYFSDKDYQNAKVYFTLALETYERLGNSKKVAEATSRIETCEKELYRFKTMEFGAIGAALFSLVYGLIIKRKNFF